MDEKFVKERLALKREAGELDSTFQILGERRAELDRALTQLRLRQAEVGGAFRSISKTLGLPLDGSDLEVKQGEKKPEEPKANEVAVARKAKDEKK